MRKIIYSILLVISSNLVFAQADMVGFTLYKTLPQASSLNPAFLPDYKVTVGLPGLSGLRLNSSQNFTTLDLLNSKRANGSMDLDAVYDGLKKNNRLTGIANVNVFHLGIRGKSSYTAFNINTRTFNRLSFPRELIDLAYYGNASSEINSENLDFSRLKFKSNSFTEIGISHGREILNGKMTVGARLKYLMGHSYTDINDFNLSLRTYGNGDSIRLSTDGFSLRNAGGSGVLLSDGSSDEIVSSLFKNGGFAIDLGATYQFNDKIKFFASVNDLGFISWKNDNYNFNVSSTSITFTGADLLNSSVEDEIDSLINNAEYEEVEGERFTSALSANIYLGAEYQLTPRQKAGAILYGEFYKGSLIPAFSAMYNFQYNTFFNFGLGATVMNGRVANIGTGFTLHLVPFQIYLGTNDLISALNPVKGRAADLRFGINLTFGNINKSKKKGKKNADDTIDTIDLGVD